MRREFPVNRFQPLSALLAAEPRADGRMAFGPLAILCAASVAVAVGNAGLFSVLPVIGREIGVPDPLIAAVFSLAAALTVVCAPFWADQTDTTGRKRVIMIGTFGFAISMLACAVVVAVGVRHVLAPMTVFVLFLLARGLNGALSSASQPAMQAYIADNTSPAHRTSAISTLAGTFGLGSILGPLAAPLLVGPPLGLASPMFVFALAGFCLLAVVARWLPESVRPAPAADASHVQEKASLLSVIRDQDLRPFLIFGALVSLLQAGMAQMIAFVVIDKVGLPARAALPHISGALMIGAILTVIGQWGFVHAFSMRPRDLLRWGSGLSALGSAVIVASSSFWPLVAGFGLFSLGMAFLRPGFTAGASLAATPAAQAMLASVLMMMVGASFAISPLFVLLYVTHHHAPFILFTVVTAGLLAYCYANARLKTSGAAPYAPAIGE